MEAATSAMRDVRLGATEPPRRKRVAYIRSILDKDVVADYHEGDWHNLRSWLDFWVGQRVHPDPFGYGKRRDRPPPPSDIQHHYIICHSNAADDAVLDWLLQQSRPDGWRLSREDFTVYLSPAQADDLANQELLQRLQSEGVSTQTVTPATQTEYTADDVCDAVMLSASDYVLETSLIRQVGSSPSLDAFFRDSMRHGLPQRYDAQERSDWYYASRLRRKMGHTWRYGDYPHGKSEAWKIDHEEEWKNYKCPSCGKRCKRSKGCKTTGEWWAEDKNRPNWADGADMSAARPPDFEKLWRTLSVEDVVNNCDPDWRVRERFINWKWRSVGTFSGE
ncbi:hypothetical protein ACJ41O_006062 [Fusarium nematophilum]